MVVKSTYTFSDVLTEVSITDSALLRSLMAIQSEKLFRLSGG